jgi:hypothetical protein
VGRHDEARALILEALLLNRALSTKAVRPRPFFPKADALLPNLQAAGCPERSDPCLRARRPASCAG